MSWASRLSASRRATVRLIMSASSVSGAPLVAALAVTIEPAAGSGQTPRLLAAPGRGLGGAEKRTLRMLRRLYARTIALSASPNAPWWLVAIAFAEASFFSIPHDPLLILM